MLYCIRGNSILLDTQQPLLDHIYIHNNTPSKYRYGHFATIPSKPSYHWLDHIPHQQHESRKTSILQPTPVIPTPTVRDGKGGHIYYETQTKPLMETSDISDSEISESEDDQNISTLTFISAPFV